MAGRVGRPSIPSNVHQLHGNPSKKPLASLLEEFAPEVELPNVPAWVRDEARREYYRIGEELLRYGLISQIDRNALVIVACTWGRVVWMEKRVAEKNKQDPNGESGFFQVAASGYRAMTAEYAALRGEISAYFKFCAEFGLSPASRSRVKPQDPQMQLPGMPAQIEGRVGRIVSLADYA